MSAFQLLNDLGDPLTVVRFSGEEAMSTCYRFALTAKLDHNHPALSAATGPLLGTRATLRLSAPTATTAGRDIHGIVTEAEILAASDEDARIAIVLEPRLALLEMRFRSRIFQHLSVVDIARQLLSEWKIPVTTHLEQEHRKRSYCTQYQESDLAFVQRLLASEGIFYYFDSATAGDKPGEETVVLADGAFFYPALADKDLHVAAADGLGALTAGDSAQHDVMTFRRQHRLRSRKVLLGDFDPRKPNIPLRADSDHDYGSEPPLASYHHAQHGENEPDEGPLDIDVAKANLYLEAERRDAFVGVGESRIRRLSVGSKISLSGHEIASLDGDYALTAIEHRGQLPETGGDVDVIYENVFRCVPARVPYRPPISPRPRQVAETATVVGPANEEIHVDDSGRVKVQFHWDLASAKDDTSSCWLRVAQAWAGTHFGVQFIPRVGMEVVVTFLGGDVDRPLITGCIYNGTHPTPFELPEERTTSGIRTQTSPHGDGGGFNELSFGDSPGRERVYLHAERLLEVEVGADHVTTVLGSQRTSVTGSRIDSVVGDEQIAVAGDRDLTVAGGLTLSAQGGGALSFGGDASVSVGRERSTRVDGDDRSEIAGSQRQTIAGDALDRVLGHSLRIVGDDGARTSHTLHVMGSTTSFSTGTTLIESDKDVILRCGESQLRLTPDTIELFAPNLRLSSETLTARSDKNLDLRGDESITLGSKKVLIASEGAFLGLSQIAKLNGKTVKLNCQDDPVDELEKPEPKKKTSFKLTDQDGKAMGKQRFILVLKDGTEVTGRLDDEGKAELELETGGDIIFPDVDEPKKA